MYDLRGSYTYVYLDDDSQVDLIFMSLVCNNSETRTCSTSLGGVVAIKVQHFTFCMTIS